MAAYRFVDDSFARIEFDAVNDEAALVMARDILRARYWGVLKPGRLPVNGIVERLDGDVWSLIHRFIEDLNT